MRELLYRKLATDPIITQVVAPWLLPLGVEAWENRVYQGEALKDRLVPKPYVFYTIGNSSDFLLSESLEGPTKQFFQIYIHDEPGDYDRIDRLVQAIKKSLNLTQDKDAGVITIQHIETSRDLDDDTLGTIFRYLRFEAIKEY